MKTKLVRIQKSGIGVVVVVLMLACLVPGVAAPDGQANEEKAPEGPKVTINVDATDIVQVLNAFSKQSGQSMVVGPEVKGQVTARLHDVPWEEAIEVILEPYGYTYVRKGKTVVIMAREDKPSVRALETRVFELQYLDVSDIMAVITDHLSPLGKVSVLGTQAEQGWAFDSASGGGRGNSMSGMDKRKRSGGKDDRTDFSKILVIKDIPSVLEKVELLLSKVDVLPPQVLIEARFLEVDAGVLRDLGVEFGTGDGGASGALQSVLTSKGGEILGIGAQSSSGSATPVAFEAQGAGVAATAPFNTGLSMAFQKLSGTEFEILLHALEEDAKARTLSAPRILALNNQEAAIMVGTKFPIIQSDTSGQSASTSTSLEYYENIGIQLNVVPQVCADDYIRMLVHPAVTDQTGTASARTTSGIGEGIPLTEYPILSTREADTQVIIKSGETIVIGGLLANRKIQSEFKVPFLGSIPFVGFLFRRSTTVDQEVELLIFITATIKHPEESAREGAAALRAREVEEMPSDDEALVKEDAPDITVPEAE